MNVGVDLEAEAPIPRDNHIAVVDDRLDHTAVAHTQPGRIVCDAEQLDASANANTRTYAGCEEAGTVRIHVVCIGWRGPKLDSQSWP